MPRKSSHVHKIEFDGAANLDELIEAFEELRDKVGGSCKPQVRTTITFNPAGGCITSVTAEVVPDVRPTPTTEPGEARHAGTRYDNTLAYAALSRDVTAQLPQSAPSSEKGDL